MQGKPLQPEYRGNNCTSLVACWSIAMSACHSVRLKSSVMKICSSKHTTLQNQPGGPARQLACSHIALMCELCGGGAAKWSAGVMASTLIAVRCEHEEVMLIIWTPTDGNFHNYFSPSDY